MSKMSLPSGCDSPLKKKGRFKNLYAVWDNTKCTKKYVYCMKCTNQSVRFGTHLVSVHASVWVGVLLAPTRLLIITKSILSVCTPAIDQLAHLHYKAPPPHPRSDFSCYVCCSQCFACAPHCHGHFLKPPWIIQAFPLASHLFFFHVTCPLSVARLNLAAHLTAWWNAVLL